MKCINYNKLDKSSNPHYINISSTCLKIRVYVGTTKSREVCVIFVEFGYYWLCGCSVSNVFKLSYRTEVLEIVQKEISVHESLIILIYIYKLTEIQCLGWQWSFLEVCFFNWQHYFQRQTIWQLKTDLCSDWFAILIVITVR